MTTKVANNNTHPMIVTRATSSLKKKEEMIAHKNTVKKSSLGMMSYY